MFDPQDHFKGTYHKDNKNTDVSMSLPQGLPTENGRPYDVYHPTFGWIDSELAEKLNRNKPVEYPKTQTDEFSKEILGEFVKECKHEPIDIGFVAPKMVCKLCDKDL